MTFMVTPFSHYETKEKVPKYMLFATFSFVVVLIIVGFGVFQWDSLNVRLSIAKNVDSFSHSRMSLVEMVPLGPWVGFAGVYLIASLSIGSLGLAMDKAVADRLIKVPKDTVSTWRLGYRDFDQIVEVGRRRTIQ
jgi:hypothetical protein